MQNIKELTPKEGDKKIRMFPTPYQSIQKPPTFEVRSHHSHNSSISRSDHYNSVERQQHSVLNAFDFAAIDEMDPALCNLL